MAKIINRYTVFYLPIAPEPLQLEPCDICGRNFADYVLPKHIKICEKNAAKKRKVFNSAKQRSEGTDISGAPKADPRKLEKAVRKTNSVTTHYIDRCLEVTGLFCLIQCMCAKWCSLAM